MKILFLDHDGVICLQSEWGIRFTDPDSIFDPFNTKAIGVLNEIIEATDCEIVVSSDWRLYVSFGKMRDLYLSRGIKKAPIGYTRSIDGIDPAMIRVKEIREWVYTHKPESWVAVDDLNLSSLGEEHFILTPRCKEGIKQCGIKEKLIKLLNNEQKQEEAGH